MSRDASSTSWSRVKGQAVTSMAHAWSRRRLLGGIGLLCLSGCGFQPLHAPVETGSGATADLEQELAAVRVAPMGERFGQLMRRDLQRRLESAAPGTPARYQLSLGVGLTTEVLGFRRDGTISRVRYIASGNWTLATLSVPPQIIGRSALPFRTLDAYNVPDLQFFAADTSREAMERRLVDIMAQEVVREVTIALRQHVAGGRPQTAARPAASPG